MNNIWRNIATRCHTGAALAFCYAMVACTVHRGSEKDEMSMISKAVSEAGLPIDDIEIDGDIVRVDGDIILSASGLLEGDYSPDNHSFERKGYLTSRITSNRERSIHLRWGAGDWHPNSRLRTGLKQAGTSWSSGSDISISVNGGNYDLTVYAVPQSDWDETPCNANSVGCAQFPSNGEPGTYIYLIQDLDDRITNCDWADGNEEILEMVARHELGHALGFAHPGDDEPHIPGTQECTNIGQCNKNPGYATVMKTNFSVNNDCTLGSGYRTTLSNDDRNSAEAVYD